MNLLSIGGSDSSSGAGIQSDVKAFSSLGAYGLTVVTALTGQNTSEFGLIEPASKKILKNQLDLVFNDFEIDGIKIGMVYDSKTITTLSNFLKKQKIPIVIDPVIKSTTGGMLIKKTAIKDFKKHLIPLATIITPNKNEAEIISNLKINSMDNLKKVAKKFLRMGAKNIVITGIELKKGQFFDFTMSEHEHQIILGKKLSSENHGSGCNHSAAMIWALASGKSIFESAKFAHGFAFQSIKDARKIGKGFHITQMQDSLINDLSNSINELTKKKNISKMIPECQTNFVYSKKSPKSTKDILGISGRIVRTGNKITKAGEIEFGGSEHVATAVLTINKKFPQIRSAINIKFQKETIAILKKENFRILSYDRTKEPTSSKNKEGSSIKWGINKAIKESKEPPDVVFHQGDFGKEPMIIIFGKTPKDILDKVFKINL